MLIYKLFRATEWQTFDAAGETTGAPIDVSDGYIHLSTGEQVAETAAKYFPGESGVMLLALESNGLDGLKWETSRGGALFPHLYRVLKRSDILWTNPLPDDQDFTGLL